MAVSPEAAAEFYKINLIPSQKPLKKYQDTRHKEVSLSESPLLWLDNNRYSFLADIYLILSKTSISNL